MDNIYKNKIFSLIGLKKSQKSSLNHYIYNFNKDLNILHRSYQKSLRRIASRYLVKMRKIEMEFHKNAINPSDLTIFKSLTRLISTYFNISESLKSIEKNCLNKIRMNSKSSRKLQKQQLSLILREEKKQLEKLKILREEVISKEVSYNQAYEDAKLMIKEFEEDKEKSKININSKYFSLKFQQNNEYIKLQETVYLQSVHKHNTEVEYYNNVKTKSNLCNLKVYFEEVFSCMKDVMSNYQKTSKDQIEVNDYLQLQLQDVIASVNPSKDAETIFGYTSTEIIYESIIEAKHNGLVLYEEFDNNNKDIVKNKEDVELKLY